MGTTEWAGATPYDVAFGPFGTGTVRFLHADGDLYVGVVVKDPEPSTGPSFGIFFDDNHNGEIEFQEDVWRASNGRESGQDLHVDDSGSSHNEDTVNHTDGAGTRRRRRDVRAEAQSVHGLGATTCARRSGRRSASPSSIGTTPTSSSTRRPPTPNLFDPSDWADLMLADVRGRHHTA